MNRLIVVSNRVTVPAARQKPQAGGLAVALRNALAEQGGTWFGWNGRIARPGANPDTVTHEGVRYATTPLSRHEHDTYYSGYANGVLWPLFHFMLESMRYRPEHRRGYQQVNARFAAQIAGLVEGDESIWVNDYHLIPLARELRAQGVRRPIGFFLHIPFPAFDLLRALPDWRELLEQLSEYDLIGVQTANDRRALEESLVFGLGGRVVESGVRVGNDTVVRTIADPVGVEVEELADLARRSAGTRRVQRLVDSLGARDLIIGAERLDYSKGLPARLDAYEALLRDWPKRHGRTVFMQIASPSRERIRAYEQLRREIEERAGHINGQYADFDWVPMRYIHKTFARASLLGFFRTARVGFVTPLRDGMNLVAKEFVAAQDPDDPGVLVLSELAGAAVELDAALLVNPHDTDGMGAAIDAALSMPRAERRERFRGMIDVLRENDLAAWRSRYLAALHEAATHPA